MNARCLLASRVSLFTSVALRTGPYWVKSSRHQSRRPSRHAPVWELVMAYSSGFPSPLASTCDRCCIGVLTAGKALSCDCIATAVPCLSNSCNCSISLPIMRCAASASHCQPHQSSTTINRCYWCDTVVEVVHLCSRVSSTLNDQLEKCTLELTMDMTLLTTWQYNLHTQ